MNDATRAGAQLRVTEQSGGGIELLIASDCDAGGQVAVDPGSAATVSRSARAKDGNLAAVSLTPHQRFFHVYVTRSGRATTSITVDLQGKQPGLSEAATARS